MTELLNCPFCGGPVTLEDYRGNYNSPVDFVAHCAACDLSHGASIDKDQAIKNWNTRAVPDLSAENARLVAENAWLRRLIQWCKVRLKPDRQYSETLDRYLAEGVTEPDNLKMTGALNGEGG